MYVVYILENMETSCQLFFARERKRRRREKKRNRNANYFICFASKFEAKQK
jgi:hypothetical protein